MTLERKQTWLLGRTATWFAMLFCAAIAFAPLQAVCQAANIEVIDFEQEEVLLEKAAETREESDAQDASSETSVSLIKPASHTRPRRCVGESRGDRSQHNGFGGWLRL